MNDGLKDSYRKAIIGVLAANPRVERVVLFGSRAMGTFSSTSDIDLALFGDDLTLDDQSDLYAKIEELSIPQQVDLVLHNRIRNKKLIGHIQRYGVEWFRWIDNKEKTSAMGGEWKEASLGQLSEILTGKLDSNQANNKGTYPFFTCAPTPLLINDYAFDCEAILLAGNNANGVFHLNLYKGKFNAYQRTYVIKIRDTGLIDIRFLFYTLKTLTQRLGEYSHGTATKFLTMKILSTLPIPLPSLPEQRAIAHILGTLDDKIELNRRMNETLEAMARAIFKSWFVDFDPVRAKAEGRDPGLPKPIADLFPDEFEDSELGEIPKGWKISTVGKNFTLTMGQSPPGSTYNENGDGLPFYQGRTDFGFRYPSRRVFCTAPTRFAEPGDTLVSVRAPVGDVNMASERCAVGRGVASIRHNSGSRSFTHYSMHNFKDHFDKFEKEGTVFGCINKNDFERLPLVVPSMQVLNEYEHIVFPLDECIECNERQVLTLTRIRDVLLPKLISGEIRVADAERIVGRCI